MRLTGLWRNADFMRLWIGQTISELGSRITRDGIPLAAVLVLDASPAQMGLLTAVGSAPVLLLGLVAGAWVDRLRRRPIMIGADLGRAVLLFTIPLAAWFHRLGMPQLYVVIALSGILTVFFEIAYHSYFPSLVTREYIVEGNSKLAVSDSVAEVLGPGLAGFLIQLLSAPIAIFFDAISFLLSAFSLGLIQKIELRTGYKKSERSIGREIAEGLRLVFANPLLRAFALSTGTRNFFGNFIGTLYALFAIRILGMGPAALGLTIAMGGVGNLAGAFLVGPIVRRFGLGPALFGSLILGSLAVFLIPLAAGPLWMPVIFLVAAQFFGDALHTIYEVNEISLRQAITPDRILGRMNASMQFMLAGLAPLGAIAGGLLAENLGIRSTLFIASTGILLSTLWVFFSPIPRLRELPTALVEGVD